MKQRILNIVLRVLLCAGLLAVGAAGFPMLQRVWGDYQIRQQMAADPRYAVAADIESQCLFAYVVDVTEQIYQGSRFVSVYLWIDTDMVKAMTEEESAEAAHRVLVTTIEAVSTHLDAQILNIFYVEVMEVKMFEGPVHVASAYWGIQARMSTLTAWAAGGATNEALGILLEQGQVQIYYSWLYGSLYHDTVLERPSYDVPPWLDQECSTCN